MSYPKVCSHYPQSAGKLYLPSNGTEEMIFTEAFCECCIHEKFIHTWIVNDKQCDIFSVTLEGCNVPEWKYNSEGWPVCTEWIKFDWGNEEDGWNEPPEPDNPNQLVFPFIMDEINQEITVKSLCESVT